MNKILFGLCFLFASIQLSYQQCPSSNCTLLKTLQYSNDLCPSSRFNPSENTCSLLTDISASRLTPYSHRLGTLGIGNTIEIRGSTTSNNAFSINFVNSGNKNINGFHASFRLDLRNLLVFDRHRKFDVWEGQKISSIIKAFPGDYVIIVHLSQDGWKISVNNQQESFPAYIPYNELDELQVLGAFNVRSIKFFAPSTEQCLNSKSSCTLFSKNSNAQKAPLHFPLLCDKNNAVEIRGSTNNDYDIFSINFVNSKNNQINGLHVGFRKEFGELAFFRSSTYVAWNDKEGEQESNIQPVPASYVIFIHAADEGWKVTVNNISASYSIDAPYDKLDSFFIDGNLSVSSIKYFRI